MRYAMGSSVFQRTTILAVATMAAAAFLVAATAVTVAPRSANAKPEFAAQTGLPCGKCHQNPAGGGPNNAFGKAFNANGFKVKK